MFAAQPLPDWKRAVLKVGSSLLAADGGGLSPRFALGLAQFVLASLQAGREVVIVSSGAVAAGRAVLPKAGNAASTMAARQALAALGTPFNVLHQAGGKMLDEARAAYADAGLKARVEPFIADMAEAYGWADVVLCRAGALTVAELAAAGVGALLVPLPHAIDDHQSANARWFTEQQAGLLLPQAQLSAEQLAQQLAELATKPQQLLAWARAARAAARPQAAEQVAARALELLHE